SPPSVARQYHRRVADKEDQSARFRRTRAAHRDETAEDYAEAIARIAGERGEARVRDLAALMGVSHVTVTRGGARLARGGLVESGRPRPLVLTPKGKRLAALGLRARHELLA